MKIGVDINQTLIYTNSSYSILGLNKKLIDIVNELYENDFTG